MKGFAMIKIGNTGWIEKEAPTCGPMDAICKPLVELAKTDEEAARKLAEKRKYQSEATVRCYQKMKADAEAGDPEAIRRYEATLAKRRDEYHKKKARQEEVPA